MYLQLQDIISLDNDNTKSHTIEVLSRLPKVVISSIIFGSFHVLMDAFNAVSMISRNPSQEIKKKNAM